MEQKYLYRVAVQKYLMDTRGYHYRAMVQKYLMDLKVTARHKFITNSPGGGTKVSHGYKSIFEIHYFTILPSADAKVSYALPYLPARYYSVPRQGEMCHATCVHALHTFAHLFNRVSHSRLHSFHMFSLAHFRFRIHCCFLAWHMQSRATLNSLFTEFILFNGAYEQCGTCTWQAGTCSLSLF